MKKAGVTDWVLKGIYLGYPHCCINEFVLSIINHTAFSRSIRKLNGTGYVPCAKCDKKSVKSLLAVIRDNRICKSPFPHDDLK